MAAGRSRFITFEGLDGAGKSTHLAWFAAELESRGIALCVTREPGGTPAGESLRSLLLDPQQTLNAETETLLMFAARREHVDKVIRPALAQGHWVLCDRFTDASFAYQGGGSGVVWDKIAALEQWVHGDLNPDLTLYFDVDPAIARSRTSAIKAPDRYEKEQAAFYERVRAAYLRRAAEERARILIIDSNQSLEEVKAQLHKIASRLCSSES
jgi:dTMP kinase